MWSFYGWQKQLFLVTHTIYGHNSGTHGAGAGGGLQAAQLPPPFRSILHGVGGGLSILLLLFFLFLPLLTEGAHQNQKRWLWKVGRGGIHAPLLLWAPRKKFPALLCSMCSKTLPSCASLPLFLKISWFSLVIITVGKRHLMKWGAILQSWVHDLGSRAGSQGGHACSGSSASCRHIVFHKKLMFTSQSLLKFKLAGDAMFTMHNINLFCWVCEQSWALCSPMISKQVGNTSLGCTWYWLAGAQQSLLAGLGEDCLSQNGREGGSKSKFEE